MTEHIDRWIAYMKAHPHEWKKHHTEFINAQFIKADAFIKRLAKQPGGKEKIKNMYGIKNTQAYPELFND
jgi:hypothetical protein